MPATFSCAGGMVSTPATSTIPQLCNQWAITHPRYHHDHRAIVLEMWLASKARHRRYLRPHMIVPTLPRPLQRIDQLMENICSFKEKATEEQHREKSWIATDTWQLIDRRAGLHRRRLCGIGSLRTSDDEYNQLCQQIRRNLRRDRRHRANQVGITAEGFLNAGLLHEAYHSIRGWYR